MLILYLGSRKNILQNQIPSDAVKDDLKLKSKKYTQNRVGLSDVNTFSDAWSITLMDLNSTTDLLLAVFLKTSGFLMFLGGKEGEY